MLGGDLFTGDFWKAALERAIRAVANTLLSLWLVQGVAFNVWNADWRQAVGVGLGAGLVSVLLSVVGVKVGPQGSPSWVEDRNGW